MRESARNSVGFSSLVRRVFLVLLLTFLPALSVPAWSVSQLATIPVGKGPGQLAVDPGNHLVYVVDEGANAVAVIDSENLTLITTIKVQSGPLAIAINPLTGVVYVANSGTGSITAISKGTLVGTVHIGGHPTGLVIDAGLSQVYIADSSRNEVLVLNGNSGKVLAMLPLAGRPAAMAVNLVTHAVFVACVGTTGTVAAIDGVSNEIVHTVSSLPPDLASISVDSASNVVLTTAPQEDLVISIYPGNNYSTDEGTGDPGSEPNATLFIEPEVFIEAPADEGYVPFALANGIFHLGEGFITNALGAFSLSADPSTNLISVTYPGGNTVILLNEDDILSTGNVNLTVGNNPLATAFDPVESRMFVSNNGDGTVSVFDISPRTVDPAYEANLGGENLDYNYVDANPATGITYTLRLGDLYAINEAKAGAGFNGKSGDTAGVTTIPLGSVYSQAVAVNSATNKIYVGDGANFFYSVDGATNVPTLITGLPTGTDIRALAVDSGTNQIIAWDYEFDMVYVLDGADNAVTATIPVGNSNPGFIVTDSSANLAYVVLSSVYVVDPVAGSLVATIPLSGQSFGAALNVQLSRLYVLTSDSVVVIDVGQQSVIATIPLSGYLLNAVAVNPVTGKYYVGASAAGVPHVFVYDPSSNAQIADLSGTTYPQITGASSIVANRLTNRVYVGSDQGTSMSVVAAIDGNSQVVSGLAPSMWESTAHAVAMDLGSNILAGAGYSYTSLFFPTSDLKNQLSVPIKVSIKGDKDNQTISTAPLFRTHNTKPSFTITATSDFQGDPAGTAPKQVFYEVDDWRFAWSSKALTVKGNSGAAKVTVPSALATGRHILYAYATIGDVATVQSSGYSENSPTISPIGSVTFTVEK
jgi:YVTN family beta-propeller protein